MGFDIECIIDIHTYPGEYFCPVCRTLVYPNEALQSQCTHLYCMPCLAHVASNTRTCPYDGYLVTETDSKPLLESDKSLAENIGKVRVRCLYHRSGCTWEGSLSECTSHCSGCSFGNSPVICNRCGIQIVHRQVHDHAQNCPGVYQVQQAAGVGQDATSSGSTAATAAVNQNNSAAQAGASTSQALNSQSTPAPSLAGQGPSQQANSSSQAPAASASPSVPTAEQFYQKQYQQYYQQYAGYDLYQQNYPYQQAAVQQYQQNPHLPGQTQAQVYAQVPVVAPVQPQPQPQVQSQSYTQPQPQPQPQTQPQPQQLQSQAQAGQVQAQVQPPGQPKLPAYVQPLTPQSMNQPQANPQLQLHPAMLPHAQIPSQTNSSHGFAAPQSQQYNQVQSLPMQQQLQQQAQLPQYHQPHLSIQHAQPSHVQLQPHLTTPTQMPPQPYSHIQPQPQPQPQPHLQHHAHPQMRPSQVYQSGVVNAPQQSLHSSAQSVTGHQSYPQQQPHQVQLGAIPQNAVHAHPTSVPTPGQVQGPIPQQATLLGPPIPNQHQSAFPLQSQASSVHPAPQPQFHPQAPSQSQSIQQRPMVHPGQHSVAQQYVQQHPYPGLVQPQLHQPGHLAQQQPMQSQLRPQVPPHMVQQNSQAYLQPQKKVAATPGLQAQQTQHYLGLPVIPSHGAAVQSPLVQSSGALGSAGPVRPPQNVLHQPSMAQNYGNNTNNQQQMISAQQLGQHGDHVSDKPPVAHEAGLLSLGITEKVSNSHRADSVGMKTLKPEAGKVYKHELSGESANLARHGENLAKDGESEFQGGKDGSGEPVDDLQVKEDSTRYLLEASNGKSEESISKRVSIGITHKEELESQKSQNASVHKVSDESLQPSGALSQGSHAVSPHSTFKSDGFEKNKTEDNQQSVFGDGEQLQQYGLEKQLQHYGSYNNQQKPGGSSMVQSVPLPGLPPPGPPPRSQIPEVPHSLVDSQGPGSLPQPRNLLNPNEQLQPPLLKQPPDVPFTRLHASGPIPSFGRGPDHFGGPRGPLLPGIDQRDGIMGRAPQHAPEDQFGLQRSGNPVEDEMFKSQRMRRIDSDEPKSSGSFGTGSFSWPSGNEPSSLRMNGLPGFGSSSLRSQDERFNTFPGDQMNPLLKEHPWPLDPGARGAPHGLNSDPGFKFGSFPGGPPSRIMHPYHSTGNLHFNDARERDLPVGVHGKSKGRAEPNHSDRDFIGASREYLDRAPRGFGVYSSSGPGGREDIDSRETRSFGYRRRGEPDASESRRFGDHLAPSSHNQVRRGDLFGQDIHPPHLRRGEFLGPVDSPGHLRLGDPASFSSFPGPRMGQLSGPNNLLPNLHFGESFVGNKPNLPRLGEPGFRSSFSLPSFPNDGRYAGDMDPFDNSRKRKAASMGWCRICKVDCETVEGLDMHSQTREHQRMTMDMVMDIKKHNRKKQKFSDDRAVRETGSRTRGTGLGGRGTKS